MGELKEKSKEYRSALRDIGDRLKGSLQICKRGGMWEVPDGAVTYSGVSLGLFRYMFGAVRSKMQPMDFDAQSASVVGRITGDQARPFVDEAIFCNFYSQFFPKIGPDGFLHWRDFRRD